MKLFAMILVWTVLSTCHGYRILGLFPFHGSSHFVMFEQLMKALARKGHQVDVISTFPLKKPYPNYTNIINLSVSVHLVNNMSFDRMLLFSDVQAGYATPNEIGNPLCEHLGNEGIQQILRNPPNDPPYDVVLIEVQ